MEIINWIKEDESGVWDRPNLVAWALVEAMSEGLEKRDIREVFAPFDSTALEVEFKVNGVEVSFKSLCGKIQKEITGLEDQIRSSIIKDAAQRLIEELEGKIHSWGRGE